MSMNMKKDFDNNLISSYSGKKVDVSEIGKFLKEFFISPNKDDDDNDEDRNKKEKKFIVSVSDSIPFFKDEDMKKHKNPVLRNSLVMRNNDKRFYCGFNHITLVANDKSGKLGEFRKLFFSRTNFSLRRMELLDQIHCTCGNFTINEKFGKIKRQKVQMSLKDIHDVLSKKKDLSIEFENIYLVQYRNDPNNKHEIVKLDRKRKDVVRYIKIQDIPHDITSLLYEMKDF